MFTPHSLYQFRSRAALESVDLCKRLRPPNCKLPRINPAAKFDALSQRQIVRIIDRACLPAHIGLPGVRSGFPAAAGFFLAAKRAADLRAACADIGIRNTAIAAFDAQESLSLQK